MNHGVAEDSRLPRLEQAAQWLQRMHLGADDEGVMEEWLDWCQRDPLNQQAFDEMVAVWELGGKLNASAAPSPVAVAPPMTRRRALAASLAVVGLTGLIAGWWLTRAPGEAPLRADYSSAVGVNSRYTLADGSVLELGGGTRVSVEMRNHARRINLHEGELYITVHHDSSRPLSVDTGRLEVVATGTAFNVLLSAERTTVTVAEGSVEARYEAQASATPNTRLRARQQLIYSHTPHRVDIVETDPRNVIAWRTGRLYFSDGPLSEVIATVNRYARRQMVIEDPKVAAIPFFGTANIGELARWQMALPDTAAVSVTQLADGRLLVGPRPGTSE